MKNQKISIITACYNEEANIQATIESVLCQTYSNIEYIIIDGRSEDNTMSIVNKYKEKIAVMISEPDRGIYDAFNKGIAASSGDIIYFLNVDKLSDENVIKEVAAEFSVDGTLDLLYGNVELIDERYGYSYIKGKEYCIADFENGEMVPHQGVFAKKRLFDLCGKFDLNYRICSDFDFIIKCFKLEDVGIKYFNRVVASCREGGISTNYKYKYLKSAEFSYIIHKHFNKLKIDAPSTDQSVDGLYRNWLESIMLGGKGITGGLKKLGVSRVAIFGTMKTALLLNKDLGMEGITPVAFLDNNKSMLGKTIEGIKVMFPRHLLEEKSSADCILVSIENPRDIEIINSLREDFGENVLVLSWKDLAEQIE